MLKRLLKGAWVGGCIMAVLVSILLLQAQTQASPSAAPNSSLMVSSVALLSSAVTEAEIALREKQLEVARELQKHLKLQFQAGVTTAEEMLRGQYFILENEIQLLQAKQLLQVKRQCDKNVT